MNYRKKVVLMLGVLSYLNLGTFSQAAPLTVDHTSVAGVQQASNDKKTIKISGSVRDAAGESIIGATILEKGTSNGVVSDMDGNFSMTVAANGILHISYIGYVDQDIAVAGKSLFNIQLLEDTEAAMNYLRSRKEINTRKIGIIGHSCGGTIAGDIAAKDPNISFIISLAGAAVRGDSLMLKQVELISKSQGMPDPVWQTMKPSVRHRYSLLQQTDKSSDEIRKEVYADVTRTMSAEQLKDLNTVQQLSAQINFMTSPWYLHFMRYDPTASLKKIKCPVLALNGEKDIQVDADMNLTAIKQHISENGNKNVTIKVYPKLNHLFQTCEKGTLAEYGQLEETINPEVLKDMTEWIKKQQ